MTVGELIYALSKLPKDLSVKVLTNDGNGNCHETPNVQVREDYILSITTVVGWQYETVEQKIVEIS
jgi:NADH:ubiquinone oxidoreductase subunit E